MAVIGLNGRIYDTPVSDRLDALGIDAVCEALRAGKSYTDIAKTVGIKEADPVFRWLNADTQRSALARAARATGAAAWDERAEQLVREAKTPMQFAKARELGHHFRWRAATLAPALYGQKQQVLTQQVPAGASMDEAAKVAWLRRLTYAERKQLEQLLEAGNARAPGATIEGVAEPGDDNQPNRAQLSPPDAG